MLNSADFKNHTVKAIMMVAFSLILCSCDRQLDRSQVVVRNGLTYEIGATQPFTGYVVGKDRKGYNQAQRSYKKHYIEGVLNGKSEYWYMNGKIEGIENYKNGAIHGVVSRYYDNGQIRSRVHFVNGLRGGSGGEMFWNRSGKLQKG